MGQNFVLENHLSKPQPDGTTELWLSTLELLDRIAALVPSPRVHRHRHNGVLAPASPLHTQVTALAEETTAETPSTTETNKTDAPDALARSPGLRTEQIVNTISAWSLTTTASAQSTCTSTGSIWPAATQYSMRRW